jgi:hypothetical protein
MTMFRIGPHRLTALAAQIGAIKRAMKEESSFLKKKSKRLLFLSLRQDIRGVSEFLCARR